MKTFSYTLLVACALILTCIYGCQEGDIHAPIDEGGNAPSPVRNVIVENLPGGAHISYDIPNEKELLYVKAEYEIRLGVKREAKASNYINELAVEGFGLAGDYTVNLYSVGRNGKVSEPVQVVVSPQTPPIASAFASLQVRESFGGFLVSLTNEQRANLIVEVLMPDEFGFWSNLETFYSSAPQPTLAVRGIEAIEKTFAIVLRDRFDNFSDTTFTTLTPWFEEFLDKDKFRQVTLPTDYNLGHNSGTLHMARIWDGNKSADNVDFVTVPGHGLPQWFTFDLGVTTKLSRIVVFNRTHELYLYNSGAVKRWELYGATDPNPNGSFDDSWTFLMECNSHKPSGGPTGSNTNEDLEYARAGEEFTFPEDAPPVRYLRWKTYENWGRVTHVNIVEVDIFGQVLTVHR